MDACSCTRRGIRVTWGLLAMSAAHVVPVALFAPVATIAREEGRRAVEPNEDQLIVGYLGRTCNVHDRIVSMMADKGVTWTQMAKQLGLSRQALVAATKRRHVQVQRFKEVCRLLGHTEYPEGLIDEEYDIRSNWLLV